MVPARRQGDILKETGKRGHSGFLGAETGTFRISISNRVLGPGQQTARAAPCRRARAERVQDPYRRVSRASPLYGHVFHRGNVRHLKHCRRERYPHPWHGRCAGEPPQAPCRSDGSAIAVTTAAQFQSPLGSALRLSLGVSLGPTFFPDGFLKGLSHESHLLLTVTSAAWAALDTGRTAPRSASSSSVATSATCKAAAMRRSTSVAWSMRWRTASGTLPKRRRISCRNIRRATSNSPSDCPLRPFVRPSSQMASAMVCPMSPTSF